MDETFAKNPDIVFRKIADEFILVPVRQKAVDLKSVYTLNETGAFIWQALDGTKSASRIADEVKEAFAVEACQAQDDVSEILAQLESLRLIAKV